MRKHIPHPIAHVQSLYPNAADIDLLYGGNELDAMEESLVIARDLRDVLRDGENILHINTLFSENRLVQIMGKRFDHGVRRGRNYFITYDPRYFINKLEVIRAMILAKGIRYLVLTGFELAVLTTRHRAELMAWIRSVRNLGVSVILFTVAPPGVYGALGALRYSARSVAEVGSYLDRKPVEDEKIVSFDDHGEDNEASEEIEQEEEGLDFHDEPDAAKIYTEDPDEEFEHSDSDLLKTKELEVEMV